MIWIMEGKKKIMISQDFFIAFNIPGQADFFRNKKRGVPVGHSPNFNHPPMVVINYIDPYGVSFSGRSRLNIS